MHFISSAFSFFFVQILQRPSFLLAIIAAIGYIILRRGTTVVLRGAIKTAAGYLMMNAGAGILVNSFAPVVTMLSKVYHLHGSVLGPYVAWVSAIHVMQHDFAWVSYVVLFGLAFNVILVVFNKWTGIRTIFLTGQILFQQAAIFALFFFMTGHNMWETIIYSSLLAGLYWAISSNLIYPATQKVTGGAGFSVGHMQQFTSYIAAKAAPYLGDEKDSVEHMELPKWLHIFNDNVSAIAIVMTIFLGAIMISLGIKNIEKLSGGTNWFIYILQTGLMFAVAIQIIIIGVRMFVAELTESFKGISEKIIPNAVIGIDCAATYGFSPNAMVFGFMFGTIGQFLAVIAIILFGGNILVIPGFIPLFFSNATIGIYANKFGGWKAAAIICFISGLLEVFGSAYGLYVFAHFGPVLTGWMGMADWAIFAPPVFQALSFSNWFMLLLFILSGIYMFYAGKTHRVRLARAKELGLESVDELDDWGDSDPDVGKMPEEVVPTKKKTSEDQHLSQEVHANHMDARPVRILTVCGNGQGSSMIMKMKIAEWLDKKSIPNVTESCAVSEYKSYLNSTDIIVSSTHLADEMVDLPKGVYSLGVKNMLNPNTFGKELLYLIEKHYNPIATPEKEAEPQASDLDKTYIRPIRVLTVCGNGQGSSMIMKMKIGQYLDAREIPNVMESCAVSEYKGHLDSTDIIVSSTHLADEMVNLPKGVYALGVKNMLNPNTFGKELIDIIDTHFIKH